MAKPYSKDLRSRVVAAIGRGASCREAADRFGVSVSSAVKWAQRFRQSGSVAAKPMGGDHRSRLTDKRAWLLALIARRPDLTLAEVRQELGVRGIFVGYGTVWRFFAKEKISVKKKRARGRAGSARRSSGSRELAAATGRS
jgi:transposase